ncbi:carboxypeptidase M32 [Deinococcus cavernae]|uniref:Metal-dependent carboxypeptidase n=2 Tax=Deinococcus cavernae TaxID=2320857 RepID=A0A418VGX0_9DEIO|nr:carboxypeptidase M32 [Deinococcus cavernae]
MNEFQRRTGEINDLLCVLNLLNWDARTQMPPGGVKTRGQQMATVTALALERLLAPEYAASARALLRGAPDDRAAAQALEATSALGRVPEQLNRDLAVLRSEAQEAWVQAKAASNFALFAPYLRRMVNLNRQLADALGYQDHPYDALLNLYEPGLTSAGLRGLFAPLREHHVGLLREVMARPAPRSDFLRRPYPVQGQKAYCLKAAQRFGYDLERGRLDVSAHPFEISFTRQDVRITTRFQENFLNGALFGTLHETGHALYEQGIDPAYTRSVFASDLTGLYAVGGTSYGTHESQSRLWENRIGRSRAYWEAHFGDLQAQFPEQLADVNAQDFYRAVNEVRPSLIRVEADELTYDLHIMLRVDIERDLIAGELDVDDLPEVWNGRIQQDLGLSVPDDARGVLQDIHWSTGLIGSFPTYTVGNVMASQFYEAARRELPELESQLEQADYRPLLDWLTRHIYHHGRSRSAHELLMDATGRSLDPQPYLTYLSGKYREVYGLPG